MDGTLTSNEAQQLAAAQAGNREAFGALYRRHAPAVYGLALRILGDRTAAEDIVQDVFLRALDQIDRLRDGERLGAWLKRSAANACIDLIRRRRPLVDPDDLDTIACGTPGPDALASVPAFLEQLPTQTRALLWLFTVEGWTHPELAERFGRSESWSKSIISRTLSRLRANPDAIAENDHERH